MKFVFFSIKHSATSEEPTHKYLIQFTKCRSFKRSCWYSIFFFHFTSTWVLAETIHQREKIFLKYQHPVQNAKLVIYFFKISTVLIQHQQRLNTMIPYWYIGFYLNNYIKIWASETLCNKLPCKHKSLEIFSIRRNSFQTSFWI